MSFVSVGPTRDVVSLCKHCFDFEVSILLVIVSRALNLKNRAVTEDQQLLFSHLEVLCKCLLWFAVCHPFLMRRTLIYNAVLNRKHWQPAWML